MSVVVELLAGRGIKEVDGIFDWMEIFHCCFSSDSFRWEFFFLKMKD